MSTTFLDYPTVLVRASALDGYAALVAELGGNSHALLDRAGIAPADLAFPDKPLSLARAVALLDASATQLDAPDFGLQLARYQNIDVLGAVGLIARNAANLGEALAAIGRYLCYHSPGLLLNLEADPQRPGYARCRIAMRPGAELPQRQAMELCMGVAHRFIAQMTGSNGRDWLMSFRHASPLQATHYARHVQSEVLLEQDADAISFPAVLLGTAIEPADLDLQAAAERHVSNAIRRAPLDLAQQVDEQATRLLGKGSVNLERVASQLGLHPRTLQRRLQEQGLVFEDLIDQVRRRRAHDYLSCHALPLAQVAAMLGYTEQSSFIRACRRWFDATPQTYRASSVLLGRALGAGGVSSAPS